MNSDDPVLSWLLSGDVAIQYQVHRDLLGEDRIDLQERITTEGWGQRFLEHRDPTGGWGQRFYQPKWTSSHYTLLDLKMLEPVRNHPLIRESIHKITKEEKGDDGGIDPSRTIGKSDVCVNGMFLSYACYFGEPEKNLCSIIDFILDQVMTDGGFNCRKNRSGARHSSLHSTLSVLEGILEYEKNGYTYRLDELRAAAASSREFILAHRLYRSSRTGEVIRPEFLRIPYPPRWKYNILRCLDYFRAAGVPYDDRMADALEVLVSKRLGDGCWPLQAAHPGQVHFRMEEPRLPSRWNTLIALRVLKTYGEGF